MLRTSKVKVHELTTWQCYENKIGKSNRICFDYCLPRYHVTFPFHIKFLFDYIYIANDYNYEKQTKDMNQFMNKESEFIIIPL